MTEKKLTVRFNGVAATLPLTTVFVILKLTHMISWSWWWVFFSPVLICGTLALLFIFFVLVLMSGGGRR